MQKQTSSNDPKRIRILFLGDSDTGKSTLIATAITQNYNSLSSMKDRFEENVLNPILLPADASLQNFHTELIDTFGSEEDKLDVARLQILKSEIIESSAIVLCYDISREQTVDSIKEFWLPLIQKVNPKVPVLIAANKLDLVKEMEEEDEAVSYFTRIRKVVRPFMRDFP
jgi:small GTP-binding protein